MNTRRQSTGFTLIELVLLIIVLSLASASLVQVFGQVTRGLNSNHDIQVASQLAQECSEYLLGLRRNSGYSMGGKNDCSTILPFNGYGPPVVILTNNYIDTQACPTATCKLFQVTATYNSGVAKTQLMMVSY